MVDGDVTPIERRWVGPLLGLLRLAMAWLFLWPFFDKLFGLGFAVCRQKDGTIDVGCDASFIEGGSITYGFLEFGTDASHTGWLFQWMASSGPSNVNLVDWLFMGALLFIGVGLLFGIAMWLASISGAVLLVMMYLAGFVWPQHNPFLDDHLVYALVLIILAAAGAGRWLGLGRSWWGRNLVRRYPFLR